MPKLHHALFTLALAGIASTLALGKLRRAFPSSSRRRNRLEGELQPLGRRSAEPPHEHLVRSAEC